MKCNTSSISNEVHRVFVEFFTAECKKTDCDPYFLSTPLVERSMTMILKDVKFSFEGTDIPLDAFSPSSGFSPFSGIVPEGEEFQANFILEYRRKDASYCIIA
jgi:hypothetical protein